MCGSVVYISVMCGVSVMCVRVWYMSECDVCACVCVCEYVSVSMCVCESVVYE